MRHELRTQFRQVLRIGYFALGGLAFIAVTNVEAATTNEWVVTIDQSPPHDYVADSLEKLDGYLYPNIPNPNWCCLAVGNYGEILEPDLDDDPTIPFFRLTDDIQETGLTVLGGPLSGAPGCKGSDCLSIWAFLGDFRSPDDFVSTFNAILTYLPDVSPLFNNLEQGTYPVFTRPRSPQIGPTAVWAVTLSIAPESSTLLMCICGLVVVTGVRRKPRAKRLSSLRPLT